MPNLLVFRPADANETAQAWKYLLENADTPSALLLSRQGLTVLDQTTYPPAENLNKGAYVLIGADKPDLLLLASGSEVHFAIEAQKQLADDSIAAQVVSFPCWELFEKQDQEYKDSVLPPDVTARIAIEAGVAQGWEKYIGTEGIFVGMSTFGTSAPAKQAFQKFGITTENIIKTAKGLVKK
jgi:transketolase